MKEEEKNTFSTQVAQGCSLTLPCSVGNYKDSLHLRWAWRPRTKFCLLSTPGMTSSPGEVPAEGEGPLECVVGEGDEGYQFWS